MKRICMAFLGLLFIWTGAAQTKPVPKKPATSKVPAKSDMDRMMEEAMKGMSKEDQESMRKMMQEAKPALENMMNSTADYPEFTNNEALIPARDAAKISSIGKRSFTKSELLQNTQLLYTKLTTNAPAEEKAIISQVLAKHKKADEIMAAASTAFLMGHRPAAAGLAMKAVLADPNSLVYQNNLAAILTQTGYPEKAIPYLNSLRQVKPFNSTLNSNLGYAWFYLGELDSASRYIQFALRRNPAHAEAQLCAGVIAEAQGDEPSATHAYEESFTETASHLPVKMLQNKGRTNPAEKVDYERLIHSITIFEYFDSNWSKLPAIVNDVSAWEQNKAVIMGLDTMHEKVSKEIEGFKEEASREIDALMKSDNTKEGDVFASEMMKASLEGLNMMSKPALYILAILSEEYKRMVVEMQDSALAVGKFIEYQRDLKTKVPPDAKCQVIERKSNEFMQAVNPRLEKLWKRNLEKFRVWLNVWCTWRWFIVGNVKKTVTSELLGWEIAFLDFRGDAMHSFQIEEPSCRATTEPAAKEMEDLAYYYTDCIPEVKLPFSISTLEASANAAKMDGNDFGIRYTGKAIPNATLSYGVSNNIITEPGLFSNAGITTSEGGMAPLGVNYADNSADDELVPLPKLPAASEDDLTPLPKIPAVKEDELTPLPKLPKAPADELTPLDKGLLLSPADRKALAQAVLTRASLNKALKNKCLKVSMGKLDMRTPKLVVTMGDFTFDESYVFNEESGEWEKKTGKLVVTYGDFEFDESKTTPNTTDPSPPASTLKTVISTGMEMLKETAKSFVNLFR